MGPGELRSLAIAELDAVYRLASFLCDHLHEAEDAVQETYLRAFKFNGDFRLADFGIRPWLFKILHNVITARALKEGRQPALLADFEQVTADVDGHVDYAGLETPNIDWDTVDQRLKSAIADLPLRYRTVFMLCAVEDLKYREIAEIVGLPVGTVMTQIHRSRATLATRLASLGAEYGLPARKKTHTKEIDPPAR